MLGDGGKGVKTREERQVVGRDATQEQARGLQPVGPVRQRHAAV
jgi:hypothetical protein